MAESARIKVRLNSKEVNREIFRDGGEQVI